MSNIPTYYQKDIETSHPRGTGSPGIFWFYIDPSLDMFYFEGRATNGARLRKKFRRITVSNSSQTIDITPTFLYDVFIESIPVNCSFKARPEVFYATKEGKVFYLEGNQTLEFWRAKQKSAKKNSYLPKKYCIPDYVNNNGKTTYHYEVDEKGNALEDWIGVDFE